MAIIDPKKELVYPKFGRVKYSADVTDDYSLKDAIILGHLLPNIVFIDVEQRQQLTYNVDTKKCGSRGIDKWDVSWRKIDGPTHNHELDLTGTPAEQQDQLDVLIVVIRMS